MKVDNTANSQLQPNKDSEHYANLIMLAPVLLRAQNNRVAAEMVVSAIADYLPALPFAGLTLADEPAGYSRLIAIRKGQLLPARIAAEVLSNLPAAILDYSKIVKSQSHRIVPVADEALKKIVRASGLYQFPLRTPTRQFGSLLVGCEVELSAEEERYLAALAQLTAIALDNATRFDDLKEAAHEMSLVNEMAGSLAASLNGEELFNSFMDHLKTIVPVDRASLALLDNQAKNFSLAFNWESPPGQSIRIYYKDLALAGSPLETVIARQEITPGHWDYRPEGILPDHLIFTEKFESQMVIPLVAKKQALGALIIGTYQTGQYREEVLRRSLLEKLAALFALALLNSRLYEEKQFSAEYDSRIGVYNHDYFDRELALQLHKAGRNDYGLGLMMVDMDNLKTVNDQYGHLAGDAALRHVAALITGTIRSSDVVARYGGDEFGVLLPYCTHIGLEKIAEKTRRVINNSPLVLDNGQQVPLSVSIGAVISPDDGTTPRELIQSADAAMYVAKRTRDQVRIGANARRTYFAENDPLSLDQLEPFLSGNANEPAIENYERIMLLLGNNRTDTDLLRERFFSYIFHELRTPLTVIHSYAQILQTKLPPGPEFNSQRRISEKIVAQGDELVELLEELLEATRIPLGRLNLDLVEYDWVELIEGLIERLPEAHRERLVFERPDGTILVMAEGPRLERALSAVLQFALQVSRQVELRLGIDETGNHARLQVITPEYSITKKQAEELFDLYRPVRNENKPGRPKTGNLDISLYVARGLIEGHSGRLVYDPALTSFIVTLPIT